MFSKSRINEPGPKATQTQEAPARNAPETVPGFRPRSDAGADAAQSTRSKPAASVLSSDLTVTGNLKTTGDIVVEGVIDGDIRAHLLTVGETATIRGEIIADDIVINGRVIGRVRGLKVRLTSSARVEGDIIHKTIAIESGAHFEGSVQRQDDPLATTRKKADEPVTTPPGNSGTPARAAAASASAPAPGPSPAVKAATEQRKASEKPQSEPSKG
ncbi:MAG: polymer-forming cytoskeletal protein [Rhodobacteraceae bacterium]|nr:polymer-forming cytoskeletal protein [Paracoccaceae bacterium]